MSKTGGANADKVLIIVSRPFRRGISSLSRHALGLAAKGYLVFAPRWRAAKSPIFNKPPRESGIEHLRHHDEKSVQSWARGVSDASWRSRPRPSHQQCWHLTPGPLEVLPLAA